MSACPDCGMSMQHQLDCPRRRAGGYVVITDHVDVLKAQLAAALKERDEARAELEKWELRWAASVADEDELLAKNECLVKERDEAHGALIRRTAEWVSMGIERDRLRAANMCDACVGTGVPMSGPPCMCGGTGKMSDAAHHLREEMVKFMFERDRLRAALEPTEEDIETMARWAFADTYPFDREMSELDRRLIIRLAVSAIAARAGLP